MSLKFKSDRWSSAYCFIFHIMLVLIPVRNESQDLMVKYESVLPLDVVVEDDTQ